MNLFEINTEAEVLIEKFEDSQIITIKNFYKHPYGVLEFIQDHEPTIYKRNETNSHNKREFLDQRHEIKTKDITPVYQYLTQFDLGDPIGQDVIVSNVIQFFNPTFNDYKNNFWWPHQDEGFNAICYLNHGKFVGTNIYKPLTNPARLKLFRRSFGEHYNPWESKTKWEVIKTVDSEFNKLVIFDGCRYYHGMAIEDDRFFNETRINQVFFFRAAERK